ncbi:Bax inhibitor-1 family protein [Desulfococcaceae bacterium HSG8]|nr:Bax inhibitor-1 family protein [Desulfococcaceae bacterium HSG8]
MQIFQKDDYAGRSPGYAGSAAHAEESIRSEFIRKTYQHLAFAILGFVVLEYLLLNSPLAPALMKMLAGSKYSWLIVLGAFMGISWLADSWARSSTSRNMQYMGLILYVAAEAVIFVPLLFIASMYAPNVIPLAGIYTLLLFAGLTYTAFSTRKDFSFLGGMLKIGGFVAMGFIICSIIFGFSLGLFFSLIMIVFASAAILYDTSNIIHHYHPDQYVAASLSLFASVALLFWYIVRFLMALGSSD